MTVATNHAFDCADGGCGSEALLESITRLNEAGIKTVGGGKNLEEALAPGIFEVNGVKFGVLGFDDIAAEDLEATANEPGTAPLDDSYENERAARAARARVLQAGRPARGDPAGGAHPRAQGAGGHGHRPDPERDRGHAHSEPAQHQGPARGRRCRRGPRGREPGALGAGGGGAGGKFRGLRAGELHVRPGLDPEHTQGYLLEATFHGKKPGDGALVPYQIRASTSPLATGDTRAKIIGDVAEASGELPR